MAMRICVIIPTLNEESAIKKVIEEIPNPFVSKITVVDGGSSDDTVQNAKSIKKDCEIEVMIQEGRGKGMAFQTFLKKENLDEFDAYAMLDGDYSYDPIELKRMVEPILSNRADVVMGNRFAFDYLGGFSNLNYVGNKILTFIANLLYGKNTEDVCTGYWAFSKNFLKNVELKSKGFDLEANLFAQAIKKKFKTTSVSISYRKRIGDKKLRVRDGVSILNRLIKERITN
jgi:dolichol-phosphate mannosyltransferase